MQYDDQIDWSDYHAVSTTLGLVPPTRVKFANARTLQVDGGMLENTSCDAAAVTPRVRP